MGDRLKFEQKLFLLKEKFHLTSIELSSRGLILVSIANYLRSQTHLLAVLKHCKIKYEFYVRNMN